MDRRGGGEGRVRDGDECVGEGGENETERDSGSEGRPGA